MGPPEQGPQHRGIVQLEQGMGSPDMARGMQRCWHVCSSGSALLSALPTADLAQGAQLLGETLGPWGEGYACRRSYQHMTGKGGLSTGSALWGEGVESWRKPQRQIPGEMLPNSGDPDPGKVCSGAGKAGGGG